MLFRSLPACRLVTHHYDGEVERAESDPGLERQEHLAVAACLAWDPVISLLALNSTFRALPAWVWVGSGIGRLMVGAGQGDWATRRQR